MASRRKEIQIGICVILSSLVLVFGMLWLKQFRFSGGTHKYLVNFPAVEGLKVNDRVQVRGIRMGKVTGFSIVEDHVQVGFQVDKAVSLREDAKIRLATVGIVGEMIVEVQPGAGNPVESGHVFEGEAMPSLMAMAGSAGETMKRLDELTVELRDLVRELRRDDRIGGTVDVARVTLANVDAALGENRDDVRALVRDLRAAAATLREAMTAPDSGAAGALGKASRTMARADSALALVTTTTESLSRLVARLEAGEGSAGKFLADERLYDEATQALAETKELLRDIRRNPKRYFKFNVIDF